MNPALNSIYGVWQPVQDSAPEVTHLLVAINKDIKADILNLLRMVKT